MIQKTRQTLKSCNFQTAQNLYVLPKRSFRLVLKEKCDLNQDWIHSAIFWIKQREFLHCKPCLMVQHLPLNKWKWLFLKPTCFPISIDTIKNLKTQTYPWVLETAYLATLYCWNVIVFKVNCVCHDFQRDLITLVVKYCIDILLVWSSEQHFVLQHIYHIHSTTHVRPPVIPQSYIFLTGTLFDNRF